MKQILAVCAWVLLSALGVADNIVVKVTDDKGLPVEKAQVLAILKSGAYQIAIRDKADGAYKCSPAEEVVKVFVGAPNFEAVSKKYSGKAGEFAVSMKASETKGSAAIRRTGALPGIEGTVNPILDSSNRTFIAATKIGLQQNGRPAPQPLRVAVGRAIEAQTPTGQNFKITIVDITQEASLVEYTIPK